MTQVIDRAEMAAAFAEAAEAVRLGMPDVRAGRVVPVGPIAELRQRLHLTRAAFAERYGIPLETLDGWELGTTEPDAAAKASLQAIDANPDPIARAPAEARTVAAE